MSVEEGITAEDSARSRIQEAAAKLTNWPETPVFDAVSRTKEMRPGVILNLLRSRQSSFQYDAYEFLESSGVIVRTDVHYTVNSGGGNGYLPEVRDEMPEVSEERYNQLEEFVLAKIVLTKKRHEEGEDFKRIYNLATD